MAANLCSSCRHLTYCVPFLGPTTVVNTKLLSVSAPGTYKNVWYCDTVTLRSLSEQPQHRTCMPVLQAFLVKYYQRGQDEGNRVGWPYSTPVRDRYVNKLFWKENNNWENYIWIRANIKVDSKEIGENVSRVEVGGPRVQCSDLLNMGMYFTVP